MYFSSIMDSCEVGHRVRYAYVLPVILLEIRNPDVCFGM